MENNAFDKIEKLQQQYKIYIAQLDEFHVIRNFLDEDRTVILKMLQDNTERHEVINEKMRMLGDIVSAIEEDLL